MCPNVNCNFNYRERALAWLSTPKSCVVALVGAANVQAHSDRRAEKTAEAAKHDAFGPNHGGAFRPFDCGRTA